MAPTQRTARPPTPVPPTVDLPAPTSAPKESPRIAARDLGAPPPADLRPGERRHTRRQWTAATPRCSVVCDLQPVDRPGLGLKRAFQASELRRLRPPSAVPGPTSDDHLSSSPTHRA
jgi:hypothetical protein